MRCETNDTGTNFAQTFKQIFDNYFIHIAYIIWLRIFVVTSLKNLICTINLSLSKNDIYKVGKPKIRCHSCANICLLLGSFEILHSLHELASDMHMLHIYCMSTWTNNSAWKLHMYILHFTFILILNIFTFLFLSCLVQCQSPRVLNSLVMVKKTPMVRSAPSHYHSAIVPHHLVVELERAQAPAVEIARLPSVPVITRCEIW